MHIQGMHGENHSFTKYKTQNEIKNGGNIGWAKKRGGNFVKGVPGPSTKLKHLALSPSEEKEGECYGGREGN